jgi:hypothetical protein
MSEYKAVRQLEKDVEQHGEAHAVIEEAGAGGVEGEEIEIRQGTTMFDYDAGLLFVEGSDHPHRVRMDTVTRWYLPYEFGHD